jgi:hypothetical protein
MLYLLMTATMSLLSRTQAYASIDLGDVKYLPTGYFECSSEIFQTLCFLECHKAIRRL